MWSDLRIKNWVMGCKSIIQRISLFHWDPHRTILLELLPIGVVWTGIGVSARIEEAIFIEYLIFIVLTSLLMTNGFQYPNESNTTILVTILTCINIADLDSVKTRYPDIDEKSNSTRLISRTIDNQKNNRLYREQFRK